MLKRWSDDCWKMVSLSAEFHKNWLYYLKTRFSLSFNYILKINSEKYSEQRRKLILIIFKWSKDLVFFCTNLFTKF
jgi:hypothetical protein